MCNFYHSLLFFSTYAQKSNTYDKVQDETDLHSKFQFYNLTKEYFNRPILPPPLIIITHIYRCIRVMLHFATRKRSEIHAIFKWESLTMGKKSNININKSKKKLLMCPFYQMFSLSCVGWPLKFECHQQIVKYELNERNKSVFE